MLFREGIILIVHVFSTFNNTHVTVTTLNGDVICKTSAGLIGFKGSRRSTAYAAEILGLNLGKWLLSFMATKYSFLLYFELKGIGEGKTSVLKSFDSLGFKIITISDLTAEPHNGCRRQKTRRI